MKRRRSQIARLTPRKTETPSRTSQIRALWERVGLEIEGREKAVVVGFDVAAMIWGLRTGCGSASGSR